MAAFDFIREFGVWADISGLTADEMQRFDRNQKKALNAEDGGTWAPTSVIEIGGQGINITGGAQFWDVTVTGALSLLQGASVEGDMIVRGDYFTVDGGTTTLTGPTLLGGGEPGTATLYVTSASLIAHKKLELLGVDDFGVSLTATGGIIVGAASRFDAAVQFGSSITVSGNVTMDGDNVTLGGTETTDVVTLRAPIVCSDNGRYFRRGLLLTNPADLQTFSPAQTQWLNIPDTLFGVARTVVLVDSGCRDDDEFGVTNGGSYMVAVQLPSGTTVVVPSYHWANFKRFNNSWARIAGGSFWAHSVAD